MYTVVTACALLVQILGFRKINKLPITAVIPLWLFIVLVAGLIVNALITNLHVLSKPMTPDPYISLQLLLNLLMPLVILILLNFYISMKIPFKWTVLVLGSLAMFAGERIAEQVGVIDYRKWNPWYSPFLWLALICITLAFYRFLDSDFFRRGERRV